MAVTGFAFDQDEQINLALHRTPGEFLSRLSVEIGVQWLGSHHKLQSELGKLL